MSKSIVASVERLERSIAILDVSGRSVEFPRAQLPAPLKEGDVLKLTIARDDSESTRDATAEYIDDLSSRHISGRKRGNPRATSLRGKKK